MKIKFKNVVIVGPGLIGGSIGLVLRKQKMAENIIGVARHKATLLKAKKKESITIGVTDLKKAVADADLVILATPVMAIKGILSSISNLLKKNCIVIDVGSTKAEIVAYAEKVLPDNVYFIGTHPMAGSEKDGAELDCGNLFNDSICFIAKNYKSNRGALTIVTNLWKMLGAKTVLIDPKQHDVIVAQISHLPHLISVALVDSVSSGFIKFGASGFRDTTRIAAGDPEIWRDISFSNKEAILNAVDNFEKKLGLIKKAIKNNQKQLLVRQLINVKRKRDSLK
ncbi:MAG: prephenate dehydrogenase [Candidatus Omnitrophica bacterium]|nr:prephenate dehydrogenase [Candidatus Omnitrophota bacterium]